MTDHVSARERFNLFNDLTCLVKALQGKYTTIDLRNDTFVTGKITNVDGYMNVELEDVVYNDGRNKEYYFENFFVPSRNLRYVHIPETMPIIDTIKDKVTWKPRQPRDTKKPFSFKHKRATQRHLETVASLQDNKDGDEQNI